MSPSFHCQAVVLCASYLTKNGVILSRVTRYTTERGQAPYSTESTRLDSDEVVVYAQALAEVKSPVFGHRYHLSAPLMVTLTE